uniref:ATP synthase subunit b, cyanelle n=1 Tax=Cyanophora paradoxa TaxID=2762 RepID=ATPF_CYAPA|nr:ATP synthase CF0 B chain [Cyanophora paradoxa]P48084.1 RecName: Full=ATP synthase subunit b, cyanelle; AltName: Full=ATP synthase F(0) sector subunit b; AltName: Full=ATPase subunit I [Cyanophora paradoxa]AAA81255.1 b subunit of F0 portion of ATP synthase [Cyanophora paradoxa]
MNLINSTKIFSSLMIASVENNTAIFSLNTDILETNLINLLVIFFLLIYQGRPFFTALLEERRKTVLDKIKKSENSYNEALEKLKEAKSKLAQAELAAKQIYEEAEAVAESIKKTGLAQLEKDIKRIEETTQASINTQQLSVITYLRQQVALLALRRVVSQLKNYLKPELHSQFIDRKILQLRKQK